MSYKNNAKPTKKEFLREVKSSLSEVTKTSNGYDLNQNGGLHQTKNNSTGTDFIRFLQS